MTWNEMMLQQERDINELRVQLMTLTVLHEHMMKLLAHEQEHASRLNYSMEVFDPASGWNVMEGEYGPE